MTAAEGPGASGEDGQARRVAGPGEHEPAEPREVAAAACAGFGLILELLARCEARRDDLYPACAFAAAAAAEGRNILARAFALPAYAPAAVEDHGASTAAVACFVALLADVLSGLLTAASAGCLPDADRIACSEAADRAAQVCQLLAADG